jgi:hypothetical protein
MNTSVEHKRERFLNRFAPYIGLACFSAMIALFVASAQPLQAEPIGGQFVVKNKIDTLVLQGLKDINAQPSALTTDAEFLRRASLDICGVIPSGDTVRAFLNDTSPDKRAKAIDALLASGRYGEHWATLWGDLLREQTSVRNQNSIRGTYREWIEDALKNNMPYDQFMRELITATGSATEEGNGCATFYLRDARGNSFDSVEVVNTVSSVFMGTRMACAQCHDHPFDKWMQSDFHGLMAFFNRTTAPQDWVQTLVRMDSEKNMPAGMREYLEPHIKEAKEVAAKNGKLHTVAAAGGGSMDAMSGPSGAGMMGVDDAMMGGPEMAAKKANPQLKTTLAAPTAKKDVKEEAKKPAMNGGMDAQMAAVETRLKTMTKGLNLKREVDKIVAKDDLQRVNRIFDQHRVNALFENVMGEYKMPAEGDSQDKRAKGGEIVAPRFPWDPSRTTPSVGLRRNALADHIASNRQFAAVQVNRVWSRMLGRGIVDPVDDFRPKNPASNPELLDFLTDEFIRLKFDNKALIRLIANSSTYQASTLPNSTNASDKSLFSHPPLRKLTAEQAYDSIQVAAGYGSVQVTSGKTVKQAPAVRWAADTPVPVRSGFLYTFNIPSREQVMIERDHSGSVPQALEMMNGSFMSTTVKNSPLLNKLSTEKANATKVTEELYLWTLGRMPSSSEVANMRRFLQDEQPTRAAMEDVQWALLNSREFMFIK